MSRQSFRYLVFAGVLLLAACPALLRAQSTTEKSGVEFSCLVWDPLPMPEVFYLDGKRYLPLEFSLGNRSQLYPLKQATDLQLYVKDAGAAGAATYKLIGKAPLVGETRRVLFVIYPVPDAGGLPLRIFCVDDSLDTFPAGTFKFLNFSNSALQVKFAGQITKLPAGEISVVKSNVSEKGGFMPFLVGDTNGKIVFETRLFGQPAGRDMVFIGNPAEPGGLPMVKFLTQVIPPDPPKPGG